MNEVHLDLPTPLVELGRANGFVTFQEIAEHFPGRALVEEQLESIMSRLNDLDILVYEQGPQRATLGLIVALSEEPPTTMDEIGAARNTDPNVKCRFSFVCDRRWQDLPEISESTARFCDRCQKQVHPCFTPEEAIEAIQAKRCVALLFRHETQLPE